MIVSSSIHRLIDLNWLKCRYFMTCMKLFLFSKKILLLNEFDEQITLESKLIKDFETFGLIAQTVDIEKLHGIKFQYFIDHFRSKVHGDFIKNYADLVISTRF